MTISFRCVQNLTLVALLGGLIVVSVVAEQQEQNTSIKGEKQDSTKTDELNSCKEDDHVCNAIKTNNDTPPQASECDLWFAQSTIPGAGFGIFAGRDFKKDEQFLPRGDIVIPIVDIVLHAGRSDFAFLWDEYTWDASSLWMDHEGVDEVNGASPGFGAAANCFLDMINADEATELALDPAGGLHRSKDPGAGASTIYHDRITWAISFVEAGQELFVNYGENWFESRPGLGKIPLIGDRQKSQNIMTKYKKIEAKLKDTISEKILTELWDDVVVNGIRKDFPSRTLNALPDVKDKDEAFKSGLKELRRTQTMRPIEYFAENGSCLDHLMEGVSKIPQAGRGAFSRRFLPKGAIVAPAPIIHITDRSVFDMYPVEEDENGKPVVNDRSVPQTQQLLLNYCMGHPESTMVLCPYGSNNLLINHSSKNPNVKLQWGSTKRTNHEPIWLQKSVGRLAKKRTAVLAFEFVATREIWPGEEILLDYGQEWEDAWNNHVANWKPVDNAADYVSAYDLNQDLTAPLKTVFDEVENPYPDNIEVYFRGIFQNSASWKNRNNITRYIETHFDKDQLYDCEILRKKHNSTIKGQGNFAYAALVEFDDGETLLEDLPREAFIHLDKPRTTDQHLPNNFRHHIGIPDELLPKAWRNIQPKRDSTKKGLN